MRCYNGCPDSKLKAYLDEQASLRRQIDALGYRVTWFPSGEFYQAFTRNLQPVGKEHRSLTEVLEEVRSLHSGNAQV